AVGLIARRSELLTEIVEEIHSKNGRAVALVAELKAAASINAGAERLRTEFGPIDVLIANAGIGGASEPAKLQPAQVANVINVNVLGAVNSVTAVLPQMVQQGSGQLVVISSLAAYRGLPRSA